MITKNGKTGICKHVDGALPWYCLARSVAPITRCETHCTNHSSCIGYFYKAEDGDCYILPSDRTCPPSFAAGGISWIPARTMNDLVVSPNSEAVCYGKRPTPGKRIQRFVKLIIIS